MKVNQWITGIYLHVYTTDLPDGTVCGFDSDYGYMVAYKGKLIQESKLPKRIKKKYLTQRVPNEGKDIPVTAIVSHTADNTREFCTTEVAVGKDGRRYVRVRRAGKITLQCTLSRSGAAALAHALTQTFKK